jgi:hypothetical protein
VQRPGQVSYVVRDLRLDRSTTANAVEFWSAIPVIRHSCGMSLHRRKGLFLIPPESIQCWQQVSERWTTRPAAAIACHAMTVVLFKCLDVSIKCYTCICLREDRLLQVPAKRRPDAAEATKQQLHAASMQSLGCRPVDPDIYKVSVHQATVCHYSRPQGCMPCIVVQASVSHHICCFKCVCLRSGVFCCDSAITND